MNREVHGRFSEGLGLKYLGLLDNAIPELLAKLALEGSVVTIVAMGTQTKIARSIRERGAHYVLCVKDNHPKLLGSIMFAGIDSRGPLTPTSTHEHETTKAVQRRTAVRRGWAFDAIERLYKGEDWKDVASFAVVVRVRTVGDRTSSERAYYISSLPADAERIARAVRSHWQVENRLHSVPRRCAAEARNESSTRTDGLCRSYMEDEGRSLGVGFQERASNHPKLLCLRDMVVSVGAKVRGQPGQVGIRESNESAPFDEASSTRDLASKPRGRRALGISLPDT